MKPTQKQIQYAKDLLRKLGYDLDDYDFDYRAKEALELAFRLLNTPDNRWMRIKAEHLTKDLAEVTEWIGNTVAELKKFSDLMNGGNEK